MTTSDPCVMARDGADLLGEHGWSLFVDLMFAPGPTTPGRDVRPLPERGVPAALRESVRRELAAGISRRLVFGSGSGVPTGIVTPTWG